MGGEAGFFFLPARAKDRLDFFLFVSAQQDS